MSNKYLNTAKDNKRDEFYTRYIDIRKEMEYHKSHFKDKVVYCNCDDYRVSNFVKYFRDNFVTLGLKKLVATNYSQLGDDSWKYEYDGENQTISRLASNGSFDSNECTEILNECDYVVTNPPFSLFRKFMECLHNHNKQFLVVGNTNSITFKEVFPYIKNNTLWVGYSSFNKGMYFYVPDDYEYNKTYKFDRMKDGKKSMRFASVCWYTNIGDNKRKPLKLTKKFSESFYKRYENCDGVECGKVENIPFDYNGNIGVPITFVNKFCSEQFEIIGNIQTPKVNGKQLYKRILIKKKS